jgi:hypothetical protein
MAQGTANLRAIPGVLAEALQATLALNPSSEGQKTAQRDIATALETALDARRQRIIISESQVNLLKWACLFMQAVCALVAIAMVHSDNRLASIIAMGIFATGVAASILLILAHDRPFTGEFSIKPDPLLQVMPEIASLTLMMLSNKNIQHTVRYTELSSTASGTSRIDLAHHADVPRCPRNQL